MPVNVVVSLFEGTGLLDRVVVEDVENKRCFSYVDSQRNNCEICIYKDGLCFFKEYENHLLELHLREHEYAKITTSEGAVKIDAKVVDFLLNDDILVMRYVIDDIERKIEVNYRS